MIVTLDNALAGSLAPATDTETGKPMKWEIKPGALIFGTQAPQTDSIGNTLTQSGEEVVLWKSSSV